jgi:hypothetical protein
MNANCRQRATCNERKFADRCQTDRQAGTRDASSGASKGEWVGGVVSLRSCNVGLGWDVMEVVDLR